VRTEFENEISWIHSEDIAKFAQYCVDNLPDYFFHVPASSSGKYHPSYALGDGGLLRHTKAALTIAKELFNLEMFPFSEEYQDLILVSLMLHDGIKQGNGSGNHTVFEHPLYAADFIKKCNFESNLLNDEQEKFVCSAISSHMGQWNTARNSKTVLPMPKTKIEKFVHLCDYLASRKFLEVNFDVIN
jgi:hypothetical protein